MSLYQKLMSALTDAQIDTLITDYYNAMAAIASGQSYKIGPRELTRANLREIRETLDWLSLLKERNSNRNAGLGLVRFREPS